MITMSDEIIRAYKDTFGVTCNDSCNDIMNYPSGEEVPI